MVTWTTAMRSHTSINQLQLRKVKVQRIQIWLNKCNRRTGKTKSVLVEDVSQTQQIVDERVMFWENSECGKPSNRYESVAIGVASAIPTFSPPWTDEEVEQFTQLTPEEVSLTLGMSWK